MKKVYLLEIRNAETGNVIEAWNWLVWTTMIGACKYGERLHRKFGHIYRVYPIYVMKNSKDSIY